MSELRWNPFLEQWVMTATHRQDRTFLPPKDFCPLCPTKPSGVETEILRVRRIRCLTACVAKRDTSF